MAVPRQTIVNCRAEVFILVYHFYLVTWYLCFMLHSGTSKIDGIIIQSSNSGPTSLLNNILIIIKLSTYWDGCPTVMCTQYEQWRS